MAAALYLLQQWRNDKYRSREPEPLVVRCSWGWQKANFLVCYITLANSPPCACAKPWTLSTPNKEAQQSCTVVPESRSMPSRSLSSIDAVSGPKLTRQL